MKLVAEGKVAIPANKRHECLSAEGVGSMLRTKINVNLGVSRDCKDYDIEMQKVMSAVDLGAEAIMDLSSHGNTQPFRQKLTSECPDWNRSGIRQCHSLSERSGHTDGTGFRGCCPPSRRGRCRFRHTALRNHPENHRADSEAQEKDEHRQPWRKSCFCMDVHDRKREPVLRILR